MNRQAGMMPETSITTGSPEPDEQENSYRELLLRLPAKLLICDSQGELVDVSYQAADLLGLPLSLDKAVLSAIEVRAADGSPICLAGTNASSSDALQQGVAEGGVESANCSTAGCNLQVGDQSEHHASAESNGSHQPHGWSASSGGQVQIGLNGSWSEYHLCRDTNPDRSDSTLTIWHLSSVRASDRSADAAGSCGSCDPARRDSQPCADRQLDIGMSALQRIGEICVSATDEESLLSEVTSAISELLYSDNCGFVMFNRHTRQLIPHPSYLSRNPRALQVPVSADLGVIGLVVNSGRAQRVDDVSDFGQYREVDGLSKSEICVPLQLDDETIGVLNIESHQPRSFTDADLHLAETLAHLVGNAIKRLRSEEMYSQLYRVIASHTGSEYLHALVEYLSTVCEADYAFVVTRTEEQIGMARMNAVANRGTIIPSVSYCLAGTPCDVVMRTGKPLYEEDAQRNYPEDVALREMGVNCYLAVPLFDREGDSFGLIGLLHSGSIRAPRQAQKILTDVVGRTVSELQREVYESQLRENQRRQQLILEAANVGLWDWDMGNDEVKFSSVWKSQLGYEDHEIGGHYDEWQKRVHPDDLPGALEKIKDTIEHGHEYKSMFRMRHRDGSWKWIFSRGFAMRDDDDRTTHLLGIHLDITQPKSHQRALIRQKSTLERIATGDKLSTTLDEIVGMVEEEFPESCCALMMSEAGEFHFQSGRRISADLRELIEQLPQSVLRRDRESIAFGEGQSAEADAELDSIWERHQQSLADKGLTHFWSVPIFGAKDSVRLVSQDRQLGSLLVFWNQPIESHSYARQFAVDFASLAGVAIENAQYERSQRLFRTLIDQATDAIEIIDPVDGRILDVNETACRTHGYSREEYLSLRITDLDPTIRDMRLWRQLVDHMKNVGPLMHQGYHLKKDGTRVPVEVTCVHVSFDREYLCAVVRDVTERKMAEQSLRESEVKLRTLLENLENVAVQAYRADGTITFWNRASEKLYGYTAEEAIGSDVLKLGHRNALVNLESRKLESELQSGRLPAAQELSVQHRDGSNLYVLSSRILHRPKNSAVEFFCFDVDITERKVAEEELATRQNELLHSSRLSTIGEMVAALSHEVAQPLSAIGNFAAASARIVRGDSNLQEPQLMQYLETISKQVDRCGAILHRLRDFCRSTTPHREDCDVNQMIVDAVELANADLRKHSIQVILDLDSELPVISCDRIQIEQLIVNLITNARDAMVEGGQVRKEISIRSMSYRDSVAFEVRDRGVGISEEVAQRLFDPFYTTKKHGMGVGLSICKSIVDEHGGEIKATNASQEGAIFRVSLPLHHESLTDKPD